MKRSRLLLIYLTLCCLFLTALSAAASAEERETEKGHVGGEIFGKKARWYHAYLSLYGRYDDNIYNANNDTKSDLITVISPGIQLTVPGTDQPAEVIATDTTTPGGLTFGRFTGHSYRRFRAYLGYAPWFQFFADNSDENVVNHYSQAGLQYNLRGGLSFDLLNRFVKDYDRLQANRSTQFDQYYSNLFSLIATYPLSPKFQFRVDYSNNFIDYISDEINGFRNRTDNSGAAFVFYKFRPKTTAFVELRYTDLDYDTDNDRDGDQQNAYAGLTWDITAKTSGSFQAGYGMRRYDTSMFDDSNAFVFKGTVEYQFTPKTRIDLSAFHRNEESTETINAYVLTTGTAFACRQHLRYNLDFDFEIFYRHLEYKAAKAELIGVPDRKDDLLSITPSLSYAFRRWLSVSLAYVYRSRDSSAPLNSFTGKNIIIKLTGSI